MGERAHGWKPSSLAVVSIESMTSAGHLTRNPARTQAHHAPQSHPRVRHTPRHTRASTCTPLEDSALARSGLGACAAQGGQALLKPQYAAAHAAFFFLHIQRLAFANSTQTSYTTTDAAHSSWRRSGECRTHYALDPRAAHPHAPSPVMNSTRATTGSPSPSSTKARIPHRSPSSSSPAA